MGLINGNKSLLLNQIKNNPAQATADQIANLLNTYEDLYITDFKGIIEDFVYNEVLDLKRDPREKSLWADIEAANRHLDTAEEVKNAMHITSDYINRYPTAPNISEAQSLMSKYPQIMAEIIEREAWKQLDKANYSALRNYMLRYPESVHLEEIDDLMWDITQKVLNVSNLNRYLADWPSGRHAYEATQIQEELNKWGEVKYSGDIFVVKEFLDSHQDSLLKNEINSQFYVLKDTELKQMKENPSDYSKDDVIRYIDAGIFKKYELIDAELMTDDSWDRLSIDREYLPNIQNYQTENPDIMAPGDSTDIYLFGTPGTGKTCLLMGLTGANGAGYSLDMKSDGGPYAAALQQYVNEGITPGRTFGRFVTTISGDVYDEDRRGNSVTHHINLVEMSGEEFALRIADGMGVSLANMGTGATNLMANDNRKVFFIIVDATKPKVKVEYLQDVYDDEGNLVDQIIRKRYVSQLDIMNKFVSLFTNPQNAEIMEKVDAIHFVVTKADMLGDHNERIDKARNLLLTTYKGPVTQLKEFCKNTKRINYSSEYAPHVFTFSLGKFYLGDIFDFDDTEVLKIVDTIRTITAGEKQETWWDKFKKKLG